MIPRVPDVYSVDNLVDRTHVQFERKGKWFYARPFGMHTVSLRERFYVAWKVFTGQMDAVIWMEPENNEEDSYMYWVIIKQQGKEVGRVKLENGCGYEFELVSLSTTEPQKKGKTKGTPLHFNNTVYADRYAKCIEGRNRHSWYMNHPMSNKNHVCEKCGVTADNLRPKSGTGKEATQ